MDILSLHYPLPNASIDNKDLFNAPVFFEYKAIIINPLGMEQSFLNIIENKEKFYTASGEMITLGISANNMININDVINRRKKELIKFLDMGGLLIIHATADLPILYQNNESDVEIPSKMKFFVNLFKNILINRKQVVVTELNLFNCSRNFLIDNALFSFSPKSLIIQGSGQLNKTADDFILEEDSSFSSTLAELIPKVSFIAFLSDQESIKQKDFKALLSVKNSKIVLAAQFSILNGHIVFLPEFNQNDTDDAMNEAKFLVEDILNFLNDSQ
tara:strand:- start:1358 stop:2176 length:819 start_codon:yes stop_codon:yes gene_type:complete